MTKLELTNFDFEITYDNKLAITEKGFAEIDIPIRQARVLSKWLQKELKQKNKKK